MAELAMCADIQRTIYPEEITRQLHIMAQGRESSPVIDRRSKIPTVLRRQLRPELHYTNLFEICFK